MMLPLYEKVGVYHLIDSMTRESAPRMISAHFALDRIEWIVATVEPPVDLRISVHGSAFLAVPLMNLQEVMHGRPTHALISRSGAVSGW